MVTLHSHLLSYSKDVAKVSQIKRNLSVQLTEGIQTFRDIHAHSLNELHRYANELVNIEHKLSGTLGISAVELYINSTDWINTGISKAQTWKENLDKLKDWYQWLQAYRTLDRLNIGFIATEYKEKNIPTAQLAGSFYKSFYQVAIQYIISKEPTLELFNGKIFNDIIAKYKLISTQFEETTKRSCLPDWLPIFHPSLMKLSKAPKLAYSRRTSATMHAVYPSVSCSTKFRRCCRVCARAC